MNSSNVTYYPLSFWFAQFGYPQTLDSLNFYTITPLSLISLCLNIIAYRILVKAPFSNSEFYGYMKFYVLNGACLSLVLMTSFITSTRNIFEFTNSYGAGLYGLLSCGFLQATFLIFGSILEVLLLVERSFYFLPASFRSIKIVFKSKIFLLLCLIFAFLIGTIFIFSGEPNYLEVQLDEKTWYRIWFYGVTSFSLTFIGSALFFLANIIRDILPLFLKIGLNVFIVFSIKNYMRKLEMEKLAFAQKISFSIQNNQSQVNLNVNSNVHYNFISRAERNQTYTAIIMSLFSLLEHSFYVLAYLLYFFNKVELYLYFVFAAFLSIVLKLIGNLLILYIFNSLFRTEVKKSLKCN